MTRANVSDYSDGQADTTAAILIDGNAPILLICDHASNHVPLSLEGLGLSSAQLHDHISWDIGAGALTYALAEKLNAPAILATFSRLVLDANRAIDAQDLIPLQSDGVIIPGNKGLTETDRAERIGAFHMPFHNCISAFIGKRDIKTVISIHSFTPQLDTQQHKARPWHLGLLFNRDTRLAHAVAAQCADAPDLIVGLNEPYAPTDGVYYTIDRHTASRNILNLLIEVRNDLLGTAEDIEIWAQRLARWITDALETLLSGDENKLTNSELASTTT